MALAVLDNYHIGRFEHAAFHILSYRNKRTVCLALLLSKELSNQELTRLRVIEKKLKYRIHHPARPATGLKDRFSPSRWIHELGWMSAMVSRHDAREVFGKTFSRPVRLLFLNPVCAIFSMYYAYIYGKYLCPLRAMH